MDGSKGTIETASQRLTELRNGLLRLHKILLDSETANYERDVARIASRGQLLGLVMEDPWFAYLRELSRLVVRIDETLDDKERSVTPDDAKRFLQQARTLLLPAEAGQGFERRYFEALQRDPDVVIAHSAMLRLLASLG